MDNDDKNFIKKKKLLLQINSGELNKSLLYYINEARTSPKDFSRHLMINDDVDDKITNLSLFFKYSSIEVPPLIIEPNLEKCSQELLYHIISIDDGSLSLKFNKEEKEKNCLKERLKPFNLIPTYHLDLLIIGVNNTIEALSDILINKNHRKKLLSPEMKYIGIASGLLPSEKLCFVINIVHSFKIYNNFVYTRKHCNYNNYITNFPMKSNRIYNDYDDNNELKNNIDYYNNHDNEEYVEVLYNNKINNLNNYSKNNNEEILYFNYNPFTNSNKKMVNKKRLYNSVGTTSSNNHGNSNRYNNYIKNNKKEEIIDLRISHQKCISPSNFINLKKDSCYIYPKNYKMPVSVSVEKKYAKNQYGEFFPIYSRESKYDDGSILIQPLIDEYCDI